MEYIEISDEQWQAIGDALEADASAREQAAGFVHINLMDELRAFLRERGETHDDNGNPL